jgi:hypothetical protein
MPLLTYEQARPWAKDIKVEVAGRKMPPWFADPKFGHFSNDRSLKQADIETLVKWVSDGAQLRRLPSSNTSLLDAPGRVISRRSTSIWSWCARIRSNAADPSLASMTESPLFRSIFETACRRATSSSTTKTVAAARFRAPHPASSCSNCRGRRQ